MGRDLGDLSLNLLFLNKLRYNSGCTIFECLNVLFKKKLPLFQDVIEYQVIPWYLGMLSFDIP